jgi:hypothetical protein
LTPAMPARASLPGLLPVIWTQSGADAESETLSTISTLDNKLPKTSVAILALRAREVWQAPCLCPWVREKTHAEDFDH